MRRAAAILSGLLLMLFSSAAHAVDIFVAEMEDFRGEMSLHKQTMAGEKCDAILTKVRELKDQKTRMQLTFVDPPFSGYVVEAYCVRPDGSIRKP